MTPRISRQYDDDDDELPGFVPVPIKKAHTFDTFKTSPTKTITQPLAQALLNSKLLIANKLFRFKPPGGGEVCLVATPEELVEIKKMKKWNWTIGKVNSRGPKAKPLGPKSETWGLDVPLQIASPAQSPIERNDGLRLTKSATIRRDDSRDGRPRASTTSDCRHIQIKCALGEEKQVADLRIQFREYFRADDWPAPQPPPRASTFPLMSRDKKNKR